MGVNEKYNGFEEELAHKLFKMHMEQNLTKIQIKLN